MYNDYPLYQTPIDPSKSPRSGDSWSHPPFSYGPSNKNNTPVSFQPRLNVTREFSKELQQRVQSHKNSMSNKSVELIKRKFDSLTKSSVPPPPMLPTFNTAGNMYRPPAPAHDSNSSTNCVINTTVEESYWAQWKPQQTSSSSWTDTNKAIKDPASILKRSIAVIQRATRCGYGSGQSNDKPSILKPSNTNPKDEKSLKVIRKPMEILESNSSESADKTMPMKLFGYNSNKMPHPPHPPSRPFVPVPPPIVGNVLNMPAYPNNNYCPRINEQPQRDDRFVMNRKNSNIRNCRMGSIDDIKEDENDPRFYSSGKRSQSCDEKKRPKPEKRRIDKYKSKKQTRSDEELSDCFRETCARNRVRFCSRKRCEDDSNDSDSTPKDSTRTIDGYHGDIDTESYNQAKDYDFDDSFQDGQGDLDSDPFESPQRGFSENSGTSGNFVRPTESFVENRRYEQYPWNNNRSYYTHLYQCVIPESRVREEETSGDSFSSKVDHRDNRSYSMYMDHSQVYGDQANYIRGSYDNGPEIPYKKTPSYSSGENCAVCRGKIKCTCQASNSSTRSSKGGDTSGGRVGSGRKKVRSPREMDDISEKSYCTSKSNTIKDKCRKEDESTPEQNEPSNDSEIKIDESHTKKPDDRHVEFSTTSNEEEHACQNCQNKRDREESSSSSYQGESSSNDTVAVVESNKNIEERTVPEKDSSDLSQNQKGSEDSLNVEMAETVYAVHNLEADNDGCFKIARYDQANKTKPGDSMKILHRNNQALRARSSLSTDPSNPSQPAMMLQLPRSSRTATSTRSSYNKGHTYTLKSPQRKSTSRSPKQKR